MKVVHFTFLFLLIVVGCGLGVKVWKLLGMRFSSFLEEIVFSISLGWGIVAYVVLTFGISGLLYRQIAYLLLFFLSIAGLPGLVRIFRSCMLRLNKQGLENEYSRELPARGAGSEGTNLFFLYGLWIFFAITVVTFIIGTLAPPVSYDTLAYHLGAPKEYIRHHEIFYLPRQVYSNFPFTLEMLYLFSLLLSGDILAKLMHLSFGLLTALAIYAFGKRYFNSQVALLASVIFLNIPLVGFLSTTAYVDLGVTLYGFLALYGFINWFHSRNRKDIFVSAIFTGLAMGVKYPAILFCFLPLLLGIVIKARFADRVRWPVVLRSTLIFSLVALGVFSPWLIKNFFYTGNPVYPLFYNVLGGRAWDVFKSTRFMQQHSPSFSNWREVFLMPLALGRSKDIGSLFLIFLPLLMLFKRFSKPVKLFVVYGAGYFLLWIFFTHHDYRFLLPVFPGLCLVVAYLTDRFRKGIICSVLIIMGLALTVILNYQKFSLLMSAMLNYGEGVFIVPLALFLSTIIVFLMISCRKTKSVSALLASGLALMMLINFWMFASMMPRYGLARVALGRESREEFLSRTLYAYDAFRFVNESLPVSAKLLLIGENQGYYMDRDLVASSPLDDNVIVEVVNASGSVKEVRDKLKKEMGITHIFYNASEVKRVTRYYNSFVWKDEESGQRFVDLLSRRDLLACVFDDKGICIYEII